MKKNLLTLIFLFLVFSLISLSFAFSKDFVFIDLKPYANAKIINTQWWTGNAGGSDLEEVIEKTKNGGELNGPGGEKVPFKVENANLVIFGTNSAANPKKIEGIKIGMKADAIYFLHMTGWQQDGVPSYKFVMKYDDGKIEELMMQSHINSDDWCHVPAALADKNSSWAWQETGVTCGTVGLICTKWPNPSPNKSIRTIDFVSLETGAVPGLFGITLGGATAAVSGSGKLTATWSGIKSGSIYYRK